MTYMDRLIRRILSLPSDVIDHIVTIAYRLSVQPLRITRVHGLPILHDYRNVIRGWAGRRPNPGFIRAQQVEQSGGRWLIDTRGVIRNSVQEFHRLR